MNGVGTTPTAGNGSAKPSAATPPKPAPGVNSATLTFWASPAVRQKVIQAFVQEMGRLSPEAGAEWKKVFTGTGVFAAVDQEVKTRFGMSSTTCGRVGGVVELGLAHDAQPDGPADTGAGGGTSRPVSPPCCAHCPTWRA